MSSSQVAAGLDLGTNSSTLALLNEHGIAVPMKNKESQQATRSAVLFVPGQPPIIGQEALNAALLYPNYLAREMKLHIGEKDSQGQDVAMIIDAEGKSYTPVEIQALVADKLIRDANAQIPQPITAIALAVPATYANKERQSMMRIAELVGCKLLRLIEEPVAAAYTFINTCRDVVDGIFLVFDLGAGTTDLSTVELCGANPRIQVTQGKAIGGRRFDMALMEVVAGIAKKAGIDIEAAKDPATLHEFGEKTERAKHSLSSSEKALFYMNFEGKILRTDLLRSDFEKASQPILAELKELIRATLAAAKLRPQDTQGILLNGPGCEMPMIQAMLGEVLPGVALRHDIDPVTAVAQGTALAAVQAVQQDGGEAISRAGTKIKALDAVATLRAVSTNCLGCEYLVDRNRDTKAFAIIIPANSPLPTTKADTFSLIDERQTAVDVKVYEGQEGQTLDQCQYVSTVRLDGLPAGHLDVSRIVVQYSYNRSGVLEVVVSDTISKKSVSSNVSHNLGNI